jgi:hypothetical protein
VTKDHHYSAVEENCCVYRETSYYLQKFYKYKLNVPVPMGARSEARTIFGCSNPGIVGSNPTRGMDVCPRFSVLCCPV